MRLSRLGARESVLIDQTNGDAYGTHVTTYKRVDGDQFVKLFTANIGMTFDLSSAGIKVFSVLLWVVQHNALSKDEIDLDNLVLEQFVEAHKTTQQPLRLSLATFKRGINELEKAQIVAKTLRQGRYFINPNFVFNGDRIAFTTLIERKQLNSHEEKISEHP